MGLNNPFFLTRIEVEQVTNYEGNTIVEQENESSVGLNDNLDLGSNQSTVNNDEREPKERRTRSQLAHFNNYVVNLPPVLKGS